MVASGICCHVYCQAASEPQSPSTCSPCFPLGGQQCVSEPAPSSCMALISRPVSTLPSTTMSPVGCSLAQPAVLLTGLVAPLPPPLQDQWFWRVRDNAVMPGYPMQISYFWRGLPPKVDAVYENSEGKFVFFKGERGWGMGMVGKSGKEGLGDLCVRGWGWVPGGVCSILEY